MTVAQDLKSSQASSHCRLLKKVISSFTSYEVTDNITSLTCIELQKLGFLSTHEDTGSVALKTLKPSDLPAPKTLSRNGQQLFSAISSCNLLLRYIETAVPTITIRQLCPECNTLLYKETFPCVMTHFSFAAAVPHMESASACRSLYLDRGSYLPYGLIMFCITSLCISCICKELCFFYIRHC